MQRSSLISVVFATVVWSGAASVCAQNPGDAGTQYSPNGENGYPGGHSSNPYAPNGGPGGQGYYNGNGGRGGDGAAVIGNPAGFLIGDGGRGGDSGSYGGVGGDGGHCMNIGPEWEEGVDDPIVGNGGGGGLGRNGGLSSIAFGGDGGCGG